MYEKNRWRSARPCRSATVVRSSRPTRGCARTVVAASPWCVKPRTDDLAKPSILPTRKCKARGLIYTHLESRRKAPYTTPLLVRWSRAGAAGRQRVGEGGVQPVGGVRLHAPRGPAGGHGEGRRPRQGHEARYVPLIYSEACLQGRLGGGIGHAKRRSLLYRPVSRRAAHLLCLVSFGVV